MTAGHHSGFTLRDVLHVLFKRKLVIVFFLLSTLGAASLFLLSNSPRLYEATAQILLGPGREHLLDLTLSTSTAMPPRISFDLDEHAARTIEMLTSRYLSEQVVDTLGARTLCREPIGWPLRSVSKRYCDPALGDDILHYRVALQVEESIHAERVGHAALVNVSFRHEDPALAAKVVNTLGALYLERHLGVLKNSRSDTFVQEQAEALKGRLGEAEKNLEAFKASNRVGSSIKEERESITRQIEASQAQQAEIFGKQMDLNGRIANLRAQSADAAIGGMETSPAYDKLLGLQNRESEMMLRLGDRNPALIALREDIRRVRGALIQEQVLRAQTELNGWRARQSVNQPRLTELKARLQALDRVELDFNHLQQQAQAAQQDYRLYTAKSEESRIATAMDNEKIASVRVIDAARTPMLPLPSTMKLKILLAALFGLFAGVAVAFALELVGDRLETADRAESDLGVPVLASIPDLRSKWHSELR
jgi:uncharacterized protein involved in exopolysaccharide biosynthesis